MFILYQGDFGADIGRVERICKRCEEIKISNRRTIITIKAKETNRGNTVIRTQQDRETGERSGHITRVIP